MSLIEIAVDLLPAGGINLALVAIAFPLSIAIAVIAASVRIAQIPILAQAVAVYVDVVRMTPLLLHLFFVFYALPFVGFTFDAWPAAVVTFAISGAAYESEAVRAAYVSVPRPTLEAAEVLGMSRWTRLWRVTVPIAARVAIPPLANNMVEMFRATSFVAILALPDIVLTGLNLINRLHRPAEVLLVITVFFVGIGYPASRLVRLIEKRFAIP